VIGHAPTDIVPVCCDNQGNGIIFIGLSGKTIRYNRQSSGRSRLPDNILNLYDRFINVLMEGVQKGLPLKIAPKGMRWQHTRLFAPYSLRCAPMRSVMKRYYAMLETSADDRQRIVAAQLLGYSQQSKSQIASLVRASQDSNETVRNNATRALLVLAGSSEKVAMDIPAEGFIELLLSGTWTDLNKASYLLDSMTKSRNVKLLGQLRSREVLDRLIEMARWRTGYGAPARYILGRIAGIDESHLKQLVTTGKVEVIINQLRGK
jgi:hypothetical protein